MKNMIKALAIITIVAVIGFSFAACDSGGDGGNGGGGDNNPGSENPVGGQTPPATSPGAYSGMLSDYNGDGVIHAVYSIGFDYFDGRKNNIGTVTNGAFSFDLKDIPITNSTLVPLTYLTDSLNSQPDSDDPYATVTGTIIVSPNSAKVMMLFPQVVKSGDSSVEYYLAGNLKGDNTNWAQDGAEFMYADKAATITGSITETRYGTTSIFEYNVNLQQGWNIIYLVNNNSPTFLKMTSTTTRPVGFVWMLSDTPGAVAGGGGSGNTPNTQ
jgi:hypothetical protein